MIQLDNKKKIIIGAIIFLVVVMIVVLLTIKNNQTNKITSQVITTSKTTTAKPQPRVMTQDEKANVVGINPTQQAEVINDQNGLYIYRIKK